MFKGLRLRIVLLLISGLSATALGFWLIPPFTAIALVRHGGYYLIGFATLAFAYALFQLHRETPRKARWSRNHVILAALSLLIVVLWQLNGTRGFKILWDELTINATAMSMHFDREVFVPLKAHDYDGAYHAISGLVDKRPLFFPFLLSLVHDLTGYRPENALGLNAVLSFVCLFLTGRIGQRLGGHVYAGIVAVLLLGGLPLFSFNVTGGGFELLNVVMILVVLALGWRYLESPRPVTLNAFVLGGVLLAQTRYESALFIAAVGALILFEWWRSRRPIITWAVLIAPLLLLLVPLVEKVFTVNTAFWQVRDGGEAFDPHYFFSNLGGAVEFLFTVDGFQLSSPVLSSIGLVSVVLVGVHLVLRWRTTVLDPVMCAFSAFAVVILANFGLLLCYHWGQLQDPMAMRLAFPLLVLFTLAPAIVFGRWIKSSAAWIPALGIPAAWLLLGAVPIAARSETCKAILPFRELKLQKSLLDSRQGHHDLYAFTSPLGPIVYRRPALSVAVLAERAAQMAFHLEQGTYENVWVFQRIGIDPVTRAEKPDEYSTLGPEFILEPVLERKFLPFIVSRVSRLVAIDLSKQNAVPKDSAFHSSAFELGAPEPGSNPANVFMHEFLKNLP